MLQEPQCLFLGIETCDRDVFKKAVHSLFPQANLKFCDSNFAALKWARENQPDLLIVNDKRYQFSADPVIGMLLKLPHCTELAVLVSVDADRFGGEGDLSHTGLIDFIRQPVLYPELRHRMGMLFGLLNKRQQPECVVPTYPVVEDSLSKFSETVLTDHCYEKETLFRLAKAGEYRDEVTGAHVARIGMFSRQIAEALGLSKSYCELIEQAAPLHDIGKIGIPDKLLLKPGSFSDQEREDMKAHTTIGYEILKDSPSKYLQMGAEIALSHHEKFDGSGYPYGLKGEAIPLSARIVAVADVYDALTSVRPYKNAWPVERALNFLRQHSGTYFDPDCVEAFIEDTSLNISF